MSEQTSTKLLEKSLEGGRISSKLKNQGLKLQTAYVENFGQVGQPQPQLQKIMFLIVQTSKHENILE